LRHGPSEHISIRSTKSATHALNSRFSARHATAWSIDPNSLKDKYETGQYVLVEGDEIKNITPKSGSIMEIMTFLDENEVDPIYFDSSFLAMPDEHAEKPYHLLIKALEDTKTIGVAKVTMHQREYTVFIRIRNNGLTIHTMYYANEIANVEG
jgi:DNA end-binding protein Ku